jgi:hypothetical protein
MADDPAARLPDGDTQSAAPTVINVTACGDRRTLETLYLELREMARQKGLEIEYRLDLNKPADQPKS